MELLLNTVWLLLSLLGMVVCVRQQRGTSTRQRGWIRIFVAIGLIALFMFPVISATDDLHPLQAVLEESATKKITPVMNGPSPNAVWQAAMLPLIVALLIFGLLLFAAEAFIDRSSAMLLRGCPRHLDGRAPPVFAN